MRNFDPLGAIFGSQQMSGDPLSMDAQFMPAGQQGQGAQLGDTLNQPFIPTPVPMLQPPTVSQKLVDAGLAMIQADQAGLGLGGSLASGMKAYNASMDEYRQNARKQREEQLAEYELMGRIRERQNAEMAQRKRQSMLDELAKKDPKMADLISLDPDMAAKVMAEKMMSEGTARQIFSGNAMDAQVQNILLAGDPSSPEYLAAYNIQKQPRVIVGADGTPVTITPDMSAYRVPVQMPQNIDPVSQNSGRVMPPGLPPQYMGIGEGTTASAGILGDNTQDQTFDPLSVQPGMGMGSPGGVTFGNPEMSKVEGYDIVQGARPTGQDAKAVKEISEAHQNIKKLMDEREALIKNNPNPLVGSADALKLDQNTNQLALKIKSLEQTGALDAGSVDVMMNAIGDPVVRGISFGSPIKSARESLTKTYGGEKLSKDMLKSGRSYIENTLDSAATARGYKKKGISTNIEGVDLKAKYGLE